MTDNHLIDALSKVAAHMRADAAELIQHRGSKGREREAQLMTGYLKRYLPRVVDVQHSAEVVDSTGQVSPECDVVIVDPHTPPLYTGESYRILPVECVFGVIEVKSNLDTKELTDSLNKIRKLKQLRKTAFRPQVGDIRWTHTRAGREYDYFPMAGHIFAYDGISLPTLCSKLRQLQADVPLDERVDGIFILDKGLVLYQTPTGSCVPSCASDSDPIVGIEAKNPLIPMTMVLQNTYYGARTSGLRISDYLQGDAWGDIVIAT